MSNDQKDHKPDKQHPGPEHPHVPPGPPDNRPIGPHEPPRPPGHRPVA